MNLRGEKKVNVGTIIDQKAGEDQDFTKFVDSNFEELWKDIEEDSKDLDRKSLSKKMFILGYVMCRETINNLVAKMEEDFKNDPSKFEQMLKEASANSKE